MRTHFTPIAAIVVLLGVAINACLFGQDKKTQPIESAELGKTKNVHKSGDLFFAGQFTPGDLELISDAKFLRIITLRTDGEIDWDEEKAVKEKGIDFVKVPFRSPEALTDDVFDRIRKLLRDKSKKTLFHCGSANRVGGVWLPFRVLDEGVDLDKALKEAKEIGLRTPFIEEKAIEYIKRKKATAPSVKNGETSVKPGINSGFKAADLDVDKMIQRFELESREIYLQRAEILDACEVNFGEVVADVGAGTGLFTRLFSKAVGDTGWVFAIDIAPRLVQHITAQAEAETLDNITGVVCAETSINLPSESVDLVYVCDTYHHFEFPKSTLASIYRALRSEGRMIVIDFERIEGKTRDWLLDHVRAGKEVFRAEIQDAGFNFVEEKKLAGLEENYFLVFKK